MVTPNKGGQSKKRMTSVALSAARLAARATALATTLWEIADMTQVLIDRELLERLLYSNSPARFDATEYNAARAELFAILANPAQQGEAVEVVEVSKPSHRNPA